MPRSTANKNYRTFVAGMITEASPLTYPENASIREDNCIIFRKGNRTRRLGFEKEDQGVLSEYSYSATNNAIQEFSWEAVNETGEVDLLVVRVGNFIYFYSNNEDNVSASRRSSLLIDIRAYRSEDSPNVELSETRISFASGRGYLFVVGEHLTPFSVEYVNDTQINVRPIEVRIRDFVGVDDGLANDFEPPTLSNEHLYNLRNQGWVAPSSAIGNTTGTSSNNAGSGLSYTDGELRIQMDGFFGRGIGIPASNSPITQYYNQIGVYPGNNKQWWLGRLEVDDPDRNLKAGQFDPELLKDTYVGNTPAARGHFILNAFRRDRSEVGNVPDLEVEFKTTRPNSVSFYEGRVWYGHESDLYYSQTLKDYRQAGNCFQEADPTSEEISDLIATDGGIIPIPEAFNIKRLYPLGGGLCVFAENGLWFISGGDGSGFNALDIAVSKISSNGILGAETLVEANGVIYWWSPSGIMSMSQSSGAFGPQVGIFDRVNISETTILSFYNNEIPEESKTYAKGIYDPARNIIQWIYQGFDNRDTFRYNYDKILNLDITLQAFYPWSITPNPELKFICGVYSRTGVKRIETPGITSQEGIDTLNSYIKFIYAERKPSINAQCIGFGDFKSTNYLDFGQYRYLSYMETGYEILEDLMRNKQSNYVFLYFRRTDDERFNTQSHCLFQTKWDWSRSEKSGRWGRKVQGYRVTDRFDHSAVVSTKHKARGHGRALQLRFESDEPNTTFDLLGWATHFTGNTTV